MTTRSIIIRSEQIRSLAIAAISQLQVCEEHPKEVLIRDFKKKRGNPANNLMWKRLEEIANQCWIGGRKFDADTLHIYCKREYLPDVCAKGVEKWTILPNGDRELKMSTTDLNTSEFAKYTLQIEVWGADLGVQFSADPS